MHPVFLAYWQTRANSLAGDPEEPFEKRTTLPETVTPQTGQV